MVQPILHDSFFLSRRSVSASAEHLPVLRDLLDTLAANHETCAGLAANMIGHSVCIIAFFDSGKPAAMLNPEILRADQPYETQEGCLSLPGQRPARRYASIKVRYQNENFQTRIKTYSGFTAQVIQHEIDHLNGILI